MWVRAPVAQWIMQQISNLWIAGSSPAGRARNLNRMRSHPVLLISNTGRRHGAGTDRPIIRIRSYVMGGVGVV